MIIDFHSHILPRMDHGSSSLRESARQLRTMREMGIELAVATSHFYPSAHILETFCEKREAAAERIQTLNKEERPLLCLGAEVLLCEGMERMQGLEKLCIQGTRILLLEMPLDIWTYRDMETVKHLLAEGYTVVLAHIDRYLDKADALECLMEAGALIQINAKALEKRRVRRLLAEYCHSERLVAFGSDLHNIDMKALLAFSKLPKHLGEIAEQVMGRTEELLAKAVIW